jgi:hypothetical protein
MWQHCEPSYADLRKKSSGSGPERDSSFDFLPSHVIAAKRTQETATVAAHARTARPVTAKRGPAASETSNKTLVAMRRLMKARRRRSRERSAPTALGGRIESRILERRWSQVSPCAFSDMARKVQIRVKPEFGQSIAAVDTNTSLENS